MVITGTWNDQTITISLKSSSLTLSFQTLKAVEVFSFDRAGRLWTAMVNDISYRRGLDGKIVAKWGSIYGQRGRRWIAGAEADDLLEQARQKTIQLNSALQTGQAQLAQPLPAGAIQAFQQVAAFDPAAVQRDVLSYRQVYQPVGILPPDQYMAVVLQLTEGCSFNTCTFCSFYRDRPFRIKTPAEFSGHIKAVKTFLGDGLNLRRTIFLGDANALVVPTPRLIQLIDQIPPHLDVEELGGIFAFLDGFSGEKKTVADFRELKKRGLKRVYIGMESGNAELLRFLRKPGTPQDVLDAVNNIKEAGVSVGVIILLGAGGQRYAGQHVADTISAIHRMHLDLDDLIYFSELVESEGLQYTQDAYSSAVQPLSPQERIRQGEIIENGLQFTEEQGTPHISRYDIREFVY